MARINNRKCGINDLIANSGDGSRILTGDGAVLVNSIEYDSRRVGHGSLFVAITGHSADGHRFIEEAVSRGAVALCVEEARADEFVSFRSRGLVIISSPDARLSLARLSSAFFGHPSRSMQVIGITGTNGKTSTTYLLESIFKDAGLVCGVIGTINHRWKNVSITAENTTPESRDLQELFSNMMADGVDIVVMEVSSHALALGRVEAIDFDVAVFSNLTRDHLDFHGNFNDYFTAKKSIFTLLAKSKKPHRVGLVNIDDDYARKILAERNTYPYPMLSYGLDEWADYRPEPKSVIIGIDGCRYALVKPEAGLSVSMSVAGRFQVYNSLAAISAARGLGISWSSIQKGLSEAGNIPGRFDVIHSRLGFSVVVDYAHTSDALEKLLDSARELSAGKIITVFGCGGDRDKSKRPIMGRIADEKSDFVIITNDNPRMEDPDAIISDIRSGMKRNAMVLKDRDEAIRKAIEEAKESDLVVIAGKGHEDYQIIGSEKRHFNDIETAAGYLKMREAS